MFLIGLLSLTGFAFINYLVKSVDHQYNIVKSIELADETFKEFKLDSYSNVLAIFGLTTDSTQSSGSVSLRQTTDGFSVDGVASPNANYGNTAGDSVQIVVTVSWNRLGRTRSREFEATLYGGGLAQ